MQDAGGENTQNSDGLFDEEVSTSRAQHGANEVKAQQVPEWKKVITIYNFKVTHEWKNFSL